MLDVGSNDAFERTYMGKFREIAAQHGEFVTYERDRAARDIGLHLTRKRESGSEQMTSALCWFQLKGLKATTVSADELQKKKSIGIRLETKHLKFWYLQPVTTYLVVYLEAQDYFVVADIQKVIERQFGAAIMQRKEQTATVEIPTSSRLDREAFFQILLQSDVKEWQKAIQSDEETVRHCRRDYHVIWRLGTAEQRGVKHRLRLVDWQSKMRGEVYIDEAIVEPEGEWTTIREHWEFGLRAEDLEAAYPFCELFTSEDSVDEWLVEDADVEDGTYCPLQLSNGDVVYGEDAAGEFFDYVMGVRLNDLGNQLLTSVEFLREVGLIEISDDTTDSISVAPFHGRSV